MIGYYLSLALRNIRRHPATSALMIFAIALGIGACMSIITVHYLMGADPIPHKSATLYHVQLDSWDPNDGFGSDDEVPDQLTYRDASALLSADRAYRQTVNTGTGFVIETDDPDIQPLLASGRAVGADFFPMFDTPFLYGGPWSREQDDAVELVVVLSRELNDELFGGGDSVGESLRLSGNTFRVVGVLDDWTMIPRFYDLTTGPFQEPDQAYVPLSAMVDYELTNSGNVNCWKPSDESGWRAFLNSECIWLQMWVELPEPAQKAEFRQFMDDYVMQQKELGRFQRPLRNQLLNVTEWLQDQEVVQEEATMMLAVGIMFLLVCLLNTIGLLLSKFVARAPEIGLRRALGATRQTLFAQYMVEAGAVGALGGLLGLLFTWLGLQGLERLFGEYLAELVNLNGTLVTMAIVLAVVASMLAGLYPTWRACNIAPAAQLKSQ
ncbi:MAG: ABC transporter permease [Pseudomonadota bacterium]